MIGKIEYQHPTKCICHKGFSGYSGVVAHSNFRIGEQETTPQSLTAHTLDRSPDIAFGSSGERTEDYILHSTPRLTATS
jgi:hypothetical protein